MKNLLLPVLALSPFVAGCSGGTEDGSSDEAVLLAVLPYTGKYELKGVLHENALRMALEDAISNGIQEALGTKLTVVSVNSGDGKDVVVAALREILDGPDGDKVMGMISSTKDAHKGAVDIALEYGLLDLEVSDGSHDDEFIDWADYTDEQLRYLISTRALCNYEAVYTAQFIMEKYPTGKIALIRGNDIHDLMHTAVIRETLRDLGFQGTVIESNDPNQAGYENPDNRQDYEVSYDDLSAGGVVGTLQPIVDQAPDAVFFHVAGDGPNLRILQDLKATGFSNGIVTCGMARTSELIDNNSNGLMSDWLVGHDALADDRFHFVMRGAKSSDRLTAWKEEYKTRYEVDADTFTPAAYDATMLWTLGMARAGKPFDRKAVLDAVWDVSSGGTMVSRDDLADLIGKAADPSVDIDYDGVFGPMDIREDRTVEGVYYIERVIGNGDGSYGYEKLSTPAPVSF
ncbi:MAG: ABC transporter substrate-binding protein [Alphaproteobacteria bacterium]|nr:ABC transporter substrate-binding protein [Alphaproteobacteria bacterium]MCB9699082.1 ABC transporter substrate-binding protein [Alphaproteobacteria bacterium]